MFHPDQGLTYLDTAGKPKTVEVTLGKAQQ